jgi:hypothetical protein
MAYEDDKTYLVKGSALNRLERDLATARIIAGTGLAIRRIPGTGTEIRLDPAEETTAKQWQLRFTGQDEALVAQIRSGTLTGLGLSGYLDGMDPDEWVDLPDTSLQVWLKVTITIGGAPYTYATSPDSTATVWLASHVISAEAELYYNNLGEDAPDATSPTIDPDGGSPATDGVYYFRIGYVQGATGTEFNDYLGPLGLGWCPPDSPYLTALT